VLPSDDLTLLEVINGNNSFESQKMVAIALFANKIVFAFFGVGSPDSVHYLDCCLLLGV
jgi:hypothetical protein